MAMGKTWRISLLLLILGLFLTGCGTDNGKKAVGGEEPVEVRPTIFAFGTVAVEESQNIILDFPAIIEAIPSKNGQRVAKGEVLAVLNLADYQSQLATKEGELRILKKSLENLRLEEEEVLNNLSHSRQVYRRAVEDLERQTILFNQGAISKDQLEGYQRIVDKEGTVVANLELLKENPALAIQGARIAIGENELALLRSRLAKDYFRGNELISPLENGVVTGLNYGVGDRVTSDRSILTLQNLDTLVIRADIAEEFIGEVSLGQGATITPIADRSKSYQGQVTFISATTVEKRGETTVPIQIQLIDYDEHFLLPGFNVDVHILK